MKPIKQLKVKSVKQMLSSPNRWCKGSNISEDDMSCCLMGAVNLVYGKSLTNEKEAISKIFDALNRRRKKQKKAPHKIRNEFEKRIHITKWNDSSRVNFEDVKEIVSDAKI